MKKATMFLLMAFLFSAYNTFGQTEKLKTVFIYNFTKYIQWPENTSSGNFVIGVVGGSSVTKELQEMAKVKTVGTQAIEVKQATNVNDVVGAHIIILSEDASNQLKVAKSAIMGQPTLLVGEESGMVRGGAGIGFFTDGGKLVFEISKTNIEAQTLKVSSQLLKLGNQVQ